MSKICRCISTAGYALSKAVSSWVLVSFSEPDPTPTESLPETARAALRAAVTPRSRPASVSRATVRNAAPAGVSVAPLFVRFSSWVPDSVFQLPDLRAEDLLRDVDTVRGGGEARLVGDRDEIPEMAQLNVHRQPILTAGESRP
ncbi:MAG TPA: hypothetical protein VN714_25545 [Trebonia sp.]|nr:hypothetical protein [Trebonia sp.]